MSDVLIDGDSFLSEALPDGIIDGKYMRRSGGTPEGNKDGIIDGMDDGSTDIPLKILVLSTYVI
jgi:hypothetical protein